MLSFKRFVSFNSNVRMSITTTHGTWYLHARAAWTQGHLSTWSSKKGLCVSVCVCVCVCVWCGHVCMCLNVCGHVFSVYVWACVWVCVLINILRMSVYICSSVNADITYHFNTKTYICRKACHHLWSLATVWHAV